MTYEQALSYIDRIEGTVIGAPVKGRIIESLFIGPTAWDDMCDFMNLRIKKGDEGAAIEFSSLNKSLSVYGVSVTNVDDDVPEWKLTLLDSWELIISN